MLFNCTKLRHDNFGGLKAWKPLHQRMNLDSHTSAVLLANITECIYIRYIILFQKKGGYDSFLDKKQN